MDSKVQRERARRGHGGRGYVKCALRNAPQADNCTKRRLSAAPAVRTAALTQNVDGSARGRDGRETPTSWKQVDLFATRRRYIACPRLGCRMLMIVQNGCETILPTVKGTMSRWERPPPPHWATSGLVSSRRLVYARALMPGLPVEGAASVPVLERQNRGDE